MSHCSITRVPGASTPGTGAGRHHPTGRWLATVGALTALVVLVAPAAAGAAGLAITVPSTAGLGSIPAGTATSISAKLGTVTVTDDRFVGVLWIATVSTTVFITGSATPPETIGPASISYWSGGVTSSSGISVRTPGQLIAAQAVILSVPRTAFSALGAGVVSNSTSWNPTIVVAIPAAAIAGTYTGTITHSVA
jgi:hypothetical protein